MSWDFQLASVAERALRAMPDKDKLRVNRALNEMKADPLSRDVVALKGEYKGFFRRRVGSWRIIFGLRADRRLILVGDIRRRSSTTY